MNSLLPEKPILLYPSLAATIGLEEATMLSILDEMTRYMPGDTAYNQYNQSLLWHQLQANSLHQYMPFWDDNDIQRISQRLRDLGLILLRSAPYQQSRLLDFAFNQNNSQRNPQSSPQRNPQKSMDGSAVKALPKTQPRFSARTIAAHWQPDAETLIGLSQLNIPEHFAREQVPEFVRYWRESGESQRSWGSKFIQYVKRQWTFHSTRMARKNQASLLPQKWQPSAELQQQIAAEGIPSTFCNKVLNKFRLYHQSSGTTHLNWDMPFFSWVKEEWQKQDTPFIETRKSTPMRPEWRPDPHTLQYLNASYGIDANFIAESIPEFIHKWTEKKAIYSEWGKVFAEHVIEQWRFVQLGVSKNPEHKPISKNWQPSADCLDILQTQLGMDQNFIRSHVPEFILYWTNRAEPMHSWDNIFLRYIKQQWAQTHQDTSNERQQNHTGPTRTKDRNIAQQLSDTSWAS